MQRKEKVQDLIDRLVYLPETKLNRFTAALDYIFENYSVDVEVINGVRVYGSKTNKLRLKKSCK